MTADSLEPLEFLQHSSVFSVVPASAPFLRTILEIELARSLSSKPDNSSEYLRFLSSIPHQARRDFFFLGEEGSLALETRDRLPEEAKYTMLTTP